MATYQGILVAADGSEPSARAIRRAAKMAGHEETPLYILNVIRDMQFPESLKRMAEVERLVGTRSDLLHYVADKILSEAKKTARKEGAKSVELLTADGDPATCIVEQADAKGADLIVVGTRGLGGVAGALLGSVSRKVSNLAEQDVLIVR